MNNQIKVQHNQMTCSFPAIIRTHFALFLSLSLHTQHNNQQQQFWISVSQSEGLNNREPFAHWYCIDF